MRLQNLINLHAFVCLSLLYSNNILFSNHFKGLGKYAVLYSYSVWCNICLLILLLGSITPPPPLGQTILQRLTGVVGHVQLQLHQMYMHVQQLTVTAALLIAMLTSSASPLILLKQWIVPLASSLKHNATRRSKYFVRTFTTRITPGTSLILTSLLYINTWSCSGTQLVRRLLWQKAAVNVWMQRTLYVTTA